MTLITHGITNKELEAILAAEYASAPWLEKEYSSAFLDDLHLVEAEMDAEIDIIPFPSYSWDFDPDDPATSQVAA